MAYPDFGYLNTPSEILVPGRDKGAWCVLDSKDGVLYCDNKALAVLTESAPAEEEQRSLSLTYFNGTQSDLSPSFSSTEEYVRLLPDLNGIEMTGDVFVRNVVSKSDIALKTNIHSMEPQTALALVNRLNCVTFSWKGREDEKIEIGLVAQEVQKVIPDVVVDDSKGIQYSGLTALLCAAVSALTAKVNVLEERMALLEKEDRKTRDTNLI